MNSRVSRLQVRFEVDGDGRVVRAFGGIAEGAQKAAAGIDRAADAADNYDASSKRLLASAKAAGTVLGSLAAGTLAVFVRNTVQAEQEQAQLAAVLKSTGEAAGFNQRQLAAMADTLAQKSTFSAGEITNAQTRLLSYSGVVGETFPRALQAAIDQSVRLGISIEQSSEIIGRALESPTKAAAALAQQGFGAAFTDSVREAIKALEDAGKTAEAQAMVLDILEESYKGAAEAARGTLSGAVKGLKNDFNDLLTGDTGGEGIKGTTAAINDLAATLRSPEVREGFAAMVAGLASVVSGAAQAIGYLNQLRGAAKIQASGSIQGVGDSGAQARLNQIANERAQLARFREGDMRGLGGYVLGMNLGDRSSYSFAARDKALESEQDSVIRQLRDRNRAAFMEDVSADLRRQFDAATMPLGARNAPKPADDKKSKAAANREAAAAARAAAAALREQERAEREAARAARELDQAQRDAMASIEDWRAELAGPVAQVMLEYQRMQADLDEQFAAGILTHERYAEAMELTAQMRERDLAAAERQMNPAAELIEQMREELRLRTLNNAEARTAIDLARLGGQATAEQAQEIFNINRAMVEQERTIAVMDTFRSSLADLGVTAVRNFGDAKEAFADMMQGIADEITRRILEQWIDQLFGSQGSTGAGTGGGGLIGGLLGGLFGGGNAAGSGGEQAAYDRWFNANNGGGGAGGGWMGMLGSLVGSWFGGGRAYGGGTKRGRMYDVNEIQPELLEYGGRTMLMMGSRDGNVRPVPRATTGGDTYNINVPVQGHVDARTRNQVAGETARAISRSRRLRS